MAGRLAHRVHLSPRALALRIVIMVALGGWLWMSLNKRFEVDLFGPPGALAVPGTPPSGAPETVVDRMLAVSAAGCVVSPGSVLSLRLGASGLESAVLEPPPDATARACLQAALAAAPWPAGSAELELPLGG